jgi:menaquinone-dependent protoporphyrinogen oxidase
MTVLVGYASRNGSTRQVALEIGSRLREHGLDVDVRPLTGVGSVSGYAGVVLGSALYSGGWLPEAAEFLGRHADLLAEREVWTFTVGRRCEHNRFRSRGQWEDAKEIGAVHAQLRPRSHHFFPAVTDPSALTVRQRVRLRPVGGYGDVRQRPEVNSWATTIARQVLVAGWPSERAPALVG